MILAGFASPVLGQQATFRAVMQALAEPGHPVRAFTCQDTTPPLGPVARAIALSLLDFEVQYYLSPNLAACEGDITFHTGSRRVARPADADFAFVDLTHDPLDIASFAQGTAEYPDRSTTIIAQVGSQIGGAVFTLTGPGIPSPRRLSVPGLPGDFSEQWAMNAARSPLGIDLVLAIEGSIIGLPRSVRIIAEER